VLVSRHGGLSPRVSFWLKVIFQLSIGTASAHDSATLNRALHAFELFFIRQLAGSLPSD
jgi:hypothetical protein